jgi:hypothetical protein
MLRDFSVFQGKEHYIRESGSGNQDYTVKV